MKLPKLEVGDVVEVLWSDAHSVDPWTNKVDLVKEATLSKCRTIGYFYKLTHKALIVVGSQGLDYDDEDDSVGATWVIPKGMINGVEVIRHRNKPEPNSETVHREPSKGGPVLKPNG